MDGEVAHDAFSTQQRLARPRSQPPTLVAEVRRLVRVDQYSVEIEQNRIAEETSGRHFGKASDLVKEPRRLGRRCMPPPSEVAEQLLQLFRRNRFAGKMTQRADRLSHLIQVGRAKGTHREMRVEALAIRRRKALLEVVGHELYELLAGQVLR